MTTMPKRKKTRLRKLGRPKLPANERRSEPLTFRCSPDELAMYNRLIEATGMALSDIIRDALYKKARYHQVDQA